MKYQFSARGHKNILGTHKTTLEFTKDKNVSLRGDCIIGVDSDFELERLKEFLANSKDNLVLIRIEAQCGQKKLQDEILAEINRNFSSENEIVIRKTNFLSDRTFATKADKSAEELDRELIESAKYPNTRISVSIIGDIEKSSQSSGCHLSH